MPAEFLPHVCLFRPGVGENRINDRGYLQAQGFQILIDLGDRRNSCGRESGDDFEGRGTVLSDVVDLSKCGIWRSPVE
ncbi:hypothetical protein PJ267_09760 [Arthrobacter sp. OVS8]|nr:hypothetical protein PJ267_09760 [Arthrobacter sp. OVS8]